MQRRVSIPRPYAVAAAILVALLSIPAPAGAGDRAEDQQLADDSVLTIDDVPNGFEEVPADDDSDVQPGPLCKQIRAAARAANAAPHNEVEFRTPGDETGSALINNQVSVMKSSKQAKAVYAAYAAPRARICLTTAYQRVFLEQIDDPSAEVQVTADRFTPGLGDAAVGYEVAIEASAQGESRTFFVNLQVIRDGRGLDAFGFFNTGSAPPSDDIDDMTRAGVDKLEAALG